MAQIMSMDKGGGNALSKLSRGPERLTGVAQDRFVNNAQAGPSRQAHPFRPVSKRPLQQQEKSIKDTFSTDSLSQSLPNFAEPPASHSPALAETLERQQHQHRPHQQQQHSDWPSSFIQQQQPYQSGASQHAGSASSPWNAEFQSQSRQNATPSPVNFQNPTTQQSIRQPFYQNLTSYPTYGGSNMAFHPPPQLLKNTPASFKQTDNDIWADHFNQAEAQSAQQEHTQQTGPAVASDLSQAATLVLNAMDSNFSEDIKFRDSAFVDLMKSFSVGEKVIRSDTGEVISADAGATVDIKGKGKEAERLKPWETGSGMSSKLGSQWANEFNSTTPVSTTTPHLPVDSYPTSAYPYQTSPTNNYSPYVEGQPQFQDYIPATTGAAGLQRRKSVHFEPASSNRDVMAATTIPGATEGSWEEDMESFEFFNGPNGVNNQSAATGGINSKRQEQAMNSLIDDWGSSFEGSAGITEISDRYFFETSNPYLQKNGRGVYESDMREKAQKWDTPYQSVLEHEAIVQQDPTSAQAWFSLGVKQQENERETQAIVALRKSISFDPDFRDAYLALAVSFTNEGDRTSAYDALDSWISKSSTYFNAIKAYRDRVGTPPLGLTIKERHQDLISVLMEMARAGQSSGEVDADVQVALGVLFNTSGEYERAQDCFRTALHVRPTDWQLMNRLGASLANGSQPEEAHEYYLRALALHPGFVRARFNLGISEINLRNHAEGARHVLDALRIQQSDSSTVAPRSGKKVPLSDGLWDTLRNAFSIMQRLDLVKLCEDRNLNAIHDDMF